MTATARVPALPAYVSHGITWTEVKMSQTSTKKTEGASRQRKGTADWSEQAYFRYKAGGVDSILDLEGVDGNILASSWEGVREGRCACF